MFFKRRRLISQMNAACTERVECRKQIGALDNHIAHLSREVEKIDTARLVGDFFERREVVRSAFL